VSEELGRGLLGLRIGGFDERDEEHAQGLDAQCYAIEGCQYDIEPANSLLSFE